MAETSTTYDRAVDRLRLAALETAQRELGGELSDWSVTFEGPSHVVVKAHSGPRFGTFAAQFGLSDQSVHVESYGTRSVEHGDEPGLAPLPAVGTQTEAVARALDEWLVLRDGDDENWIAQRRHVRAFRSALSRQSDMARQPADQGPPRASRRFSRG
jgi:hypothetical protein